MRQNRYTRRGVTRVELCIIAASLGLLGCGIAWVSSRGANDAAHETALSTAKTLGRAAADWKRARGAEGCPSITQLKMDQHLDVGARGDDPWGGRFRISCPDGEVQVRSAGGDGRFQTADDVELAVPINS